MQRLLFPNPKTCGRRYYKYIRIYQLWTWTPSADVYIKRESGIGIQGKLWSLCPTGKHGTLRDEKNDKSIHVDLLWDPHRARTCALNKDEFEWICHIWMNLPLNEFALFAEVTITQSRMEPFTAKPASSTLTGFPAKANIIPTAPSTVCEEYSFKHPLLERCWAPNAKLQPTPQLVQAGSVPSDQWSSTATV